MRIFENKNVYNAELGKWEEKFWIDGQEVDGEFYFEEMDNEPYIKEENNCCDCQDCKCVDYNEMLDYFVGRILEVSPCPDCIKGVLDQFADLIEDVIMEEFEEE